MSNAAIETSIEGLKVRFTTRTPEYITVYTEKGPHRLPTEEHLDLLQELIGTCVFRKRAPSCPVTFEYFGGVVAWVGPKGLPKLKGSLIFIDESEFYPIDLTPELLDLLTTFFLKGTKNV